MEYKIISFKTSGILASGIDSKGTQDKLNGLGENGWELVSIIPFTQVASWGSRTNRVSFIFKRKIQE